MRRIGSRGRRILICAGCCGAFLIGSLTSLVTSSVAATAPPTQGDVYAWGAGGVGQLGNGATSGATTPFRTSLPTGVHATAVASADAFSLAIGSDGKLYAWGYNQQGQLGNGPDWEGTNAVSPVVVMLPAGVHPLSISAAGDFSLAVGSDGKLYEWGSHWDGELGSWASGNTPTPIAVPLPSGVNAVAASVGFGYGLAIGTDGKLYCWPGAGISVCGAGATTGQLTTVPFPVGVHPTSVAAGPSFALAIGSDGKLYSWGDNTAGELGDGQFGNLTDVAGPTAISLATGVSPKSIAVGDYFAMAIGSNGSIYTWGANTDGELGIGSTQLRATTPARVALPSGLTALAVATTDDQRDSGGPAMAIASNHRVYSWGSDGNSDGQLGNGTTNTPSSTPVAVLLPTGAQAVAIAAGLYTSVAVSTTPSKITSAASATFTTGKAGSFTVKATGYPAPTLTETGALPTGVSFHATTGVLSGTPAAGTGRVYKISVSASNGVGAAAVQSFTLTVHQPPAFTSARTARFNYKATATFTVKTSGYPKATVAETGTLPSGLKFKADPAAGTASISGKPASKDNGKKYTVKLTAHNGVGTTATQTLTLTVD
jgi:alpha-tubulin suppressor-like RCC1 family protein